MELEGVLKEFRGILEDLLESTNASRTTIRLDMPDKNLHIDTAAAEALAPGVDSINEDKLISNLHEVPTYRFVEEKRQVLVQNDCMNADPAPPPELIDFYGVKAQMLAPVLSKGRMIGVISVHYTPGPRSWSEKDIVALRETADNMQRRLER